MKEFTYVGSLRELSGYTFMTSSGTNFYFDFQSEEEFSIQNDGSIAISIKSALLPIEFSKLGTVSKIIVETPVRDFSTGKDVILVKELYDTTIKIKYQLTCSGDQAIVDLSLIGKVYKEYLKEKEIKG